ncbi:MAG: hypothetical protein AB7P04_15450 [Bacteriovoracia bacterium]
MEDNKGKKIVLPEGHPKLVTRRDFLGHGLISGVGMAMAPSVLGMALAARARADVACPPLAASPNVPFLLIDCSGGMAMIHETVALTSGDQPLNAGGYGSLGTNGDPTGLLDNSIGIRYIQGLPFSQEFAAMPANVKAKVNSTIIAVQSGDDQSNNPFNPGTTMGRCGANGIIAKVVGTQGSPSGGNSVSLFADAAFTSVRVSSPNDAGALISLGQLRTRLNNDNNLVSRVLRGIASMTDSQVRNYSAQSLPKQVQDLVYCGYKGGAELGGGAASPNPTGNSIVDGAVTAGAFNLGDNEEARVATLVHLLLSGYAGFATAELGGFDYHNNNRNAGTTRNRKTALVIRKALEAAARAGKPLMIGLISDGSVSSNGTVDAGSQPNSGGVSFFGWASDRGEAGAVSLFAYDPVNRPVVSKPQVGVLNADNGGVLNNYATFSGNPGGACELLVANWLSFNRRAPDEYVAKLPAGRTPILNGTDLGKGVVFARG